MRRTSGRTRPMEIALGLAVASVIAAGCCSGSSSAGSSSSTGTGTRTAAARWRANCTHREPSGAAEGRQGRGPAQPDRLGGLPGPAWVKPFEQQTGCQVNAKYAGARTRWSR